MAKKDPETDARRERFRDYCRERGWEHENGDWKTKVIAEAIGKPTNKTSDLLNGTGSFGPVIAREIEESLGLRSGTFDGIGEADDFEDVAQLKGVKLSAGYGAEPEAEETVGSLKFKKSFLRSVGVSKKNARIVDVKGPSMDPTIRDGSVLLISTSNREPMHDHFFAIAKPDEGLLVKRLVRLPDGTWVARSDNRDPAFRDIPIGPGEPAYILGRAVWMGVKL